MTNDNQVMPGSALSCRDPTLTKRRQLLGLQIGKQMLADIIFEQSDDAPCLSISPLLGWRYFGKIPLKEVCKGLFVFDAFRQFSKVKVSFCLSGPCQSVRAALEAP